MLHESFCSLCFSVDTWNAFSGVFILGIQVTIHCWLVELLHDFPSSVHAWFREILPSCNNRQDLTITPLVMCHQRKFVKYRVVALTYSGMLDTCWSSPQNLFWQCHTFLSSIAILSLRCVEVLEKLPKYLNNDKS